MTISQLSSLTEDEVSICLYIVNVIHPVKPPLEITYHGLTWFKHDALIKKLLDGFPQLNPEYHEVFRSLMQKLGIAIQITQQPPSNDVTGSKQV